MFYDKAGQPNHYGKNARYLDWNPQSGALPNWLTATGTSPVLTFGDTSTRGAFRFQTKVATPTIGDTAGINTTSIDPSQYSEVGFFIKGLLNDTNTTSTQRLTLAWNDGSRGFFMFHADDTQNTQIRIYPAAQNTTRYSLILNSNGTKSKDLGFLMRNNGEFFLTAGDPYRGGAILYYSASGVWPTTPQPIQLFITAKTAAQRYAETTGVTLMLTSS